ncbi:kelch-like protein 3 isoform X2 [Scophthalmus maximus]|uniref:kelch-like protein 3 isoform X2 n=1 Tax=Scophthalmus maximus TaxID=52904 RepID=UPI0015E0B2BB|nr:kelch-like protein 3 isoform X2 [Scophthalmus maximus]
MAVGNPCLQKGWEEWKKAKGENQRRTCWVKLDVNEEEGGEEEDWEGKKEDSDGEKEEVREEDRNGAGRKRKEEWSEHEGEGERRVTREERVNEERKVKGLQDTEEEEAENEGDIKDVKEEREVKEAEEIEEENEMGGIGNGRQVRRDRGAMEAEQWEEEIEIKMDKEVEEEDNGNDKLGAQFRDHVIGSRTEEERVQQHQDRTAQKDETIQEEENFSDSVKSAHEDSHWVKLNHGQSSTSEKLRDKAGTVTGSWTMHEEEFQVCEDKRQEEEGDSTDDEDAEHLSNEDVDCNEEDVVKIFRKDDYPSDVFCTLTEFRASSLLTDLHLSTEDGESFNVHFPVLAAVSSLIREHFSRSHKENGRVDERQHDDMMSVGISRWSLSLGPEVDHVGLEAIVEFAYSGLVSRLNKDTVGQIKAAARALGATRVMDLCTEEEVTKAVEQKNEKNISASEQMTISLRSIKQLWMDQVGCDVILEGVGESLHAHRVVLATSSDYFRGMFTSGMRESHQHCVTLPSMLASELEVLIGCSYSGALPLSWRCVFEITSTALQLQCQPALTLCLNFLQEEMNPHSCLDVVSFAEAYEMVQLLEIADDFVLRQFQKVARTLKFRDLPAKQLLKYLNSLSLCVPSELVVFKAVVSWLRAKPKIKLNLAKELMKTIHFTLMTFKEFKEVQSLSMWSDHSLVELYEVVFADFWSNEIKPDSQCRIYLPKESLVLIGGDQISEDLGSRSISRELWFGNSLRNHTGIKKAVEWRRLGEMPEQPRFSHEVAVFEGQLYDPHQNSWESLAEMQQKRCLFSVVVLDGKIYAIGGHCDAEGIDSVERYCPTENSWSFTWPLDLPLSGHVAKVLQGQMFVSGGLNRDYRCLASMFLYRPETGSTYLADMTEPHAHHCMETLGDFLYVAGGVTTDDRMTLVDQLACEVYSPAADTWTAFTSLPVPHVGAGSAVLEGKFYVLGGYSQEDDSDTNMVHRYDPTTRRWENMGKMPGPNNDIRASVLCLPSHVRL